MAKAFKCDRCGKFYKCPEEKAEVLIAFLESDKGLKDYMQKDLCSICHDELLEWWKAGR